MTHDLVSMSSTRPRGALGRKSGGSSQPAAHYSKAQPKSALEFLWSVGRESGLVNEMTQSGWRMIV
jgi:hypothetical protein